MTHPDPARGPDPTLGALVKDLSEQTRALVRGEMALARVELTETVKHAGKGAGLFGGAGLVALYGVGALVTAAIAALDPVLPLWLAALVVALLLLAVAGLAALMGKKQVAQAAPVVERTPLNVQRDLDAAKSSKKGGHRG